jgi:hypothetical protein
MTPLCASTKRIVITRWSDLGQLKGPDERLCISTPPWLDELREVRPLDTRFWQVVNLVTSSAESLDT